MRPERRRLDPRRASSPRRSTSARRSSAARRSRTAPAIGNDVAAIAAGSARAAVRSSSPTAIRRRARSSSTCATLGADFVTGGTVKYLLASAGLGFLWVRREVLAGLTADADRLVRRRGHLPDGHLGLLAARDGPPLRRRHPAGAEHLRRASPASGCSRRPGSPAVEAHVAALNTRLIAGLEDLGAAVVTPSRPGAARAARLRPLDRCAGARRLARRRRTSSARCATTNLRVAAHFYNTDDDIDTLLAGAPRASPPARLRA